jgi:hypothetical protein
MKRWGIGMDKIPAGSTVINREYSVWELYKWRIIGLIVLILIESALIVERIRLTAAQKSSLKQLAYQRERAALVAQLAAAFINLPAELVNLEIEKSFKGCSISSISTGSACSNIRPKGHNFVCCVFESRRVSSSRTHSSTCLRSHGLARRYCGARLL